MASIDERLTYLENNIPVAESYDTGWVANSDWTNAEITITHNLNADLSDLIVRFYFSTDGTEANAIELTSMVYDDAVTGNRVYGLTTYFSSVNQIKIRTGVTGIVYVNPADGTFTGTTGTQYYRVKVYKPNSISVLRASLQSVGSYKYETGWVGPISDWTNAEFSVVHNLNANLSDLIVKFFLSSDGTEDNAFEIRYATVTFDQASPTSITLLRGLTIFQVGSNQIKIQTGEDGLVYIADDGTLPNIDTESYYYKVVVYHPDVISVCTTPSTSSSGVYNYPPVFQIEDRKTPSSTNGGTLTSGSWYTRELNTIARNEIVGASLSNDQFTLPPGKYEFDIEAPCYKTNYTVARLYNVTDSTVDLWSPNTLAHGTYLDYSSNIIKDVLTITETKTFKIEQYCTRTEASYGRGIAYDSGPAASLDYAIYTKVIIRQLEKF